MSAITTSVCLAATVAAYALSRRIGRRFPSPLTAPVLLSAPMLVLFLWATRIGLDRYEPTISIGKRLLGPATVALAVPLYRNRRILTDHPAALLGGLGCGIVLNMTVTVLMAQVLGLDDELRAALAIKSITAAVAIRLAPRVHADPSVVTAVVILTGLTGTVLGPWLLTRFRIRRWVARGLAMGSVAHGQGTARALQEAELSGAAASVFMAVTAVVSALIAPLLLEALG